MSSTDMPLTAIQRKALRKLKEGPVAWSKTTMAEADAFASLVEQGLVVEFTQQGDSCKQTWYRLPDAPKGQLGA